MISQKNGNVLVYNDSFFKTSQTFLYHQVISLQRKYGVILMAEKFVNPHGFDIDSFQKVKIKQPDALPGRIFSKLVRSKYDTTFHVDIPSYFRFKKVLKKGKISAIHAHFGQNAVQLFPFAKKYSIPLVVTFHGYDASQALSDEIYRKKLPGLFDYASAVIIVSSHMLDTLNLKPWKDKVHVIPCSVDPEDFMVRTENNSSTLRILHSGRLTAKKGVPDLIRVFHNLTKTHSGIELHLVGDGKEMEECRSLVEEFKLDGIVQFYGAVSHKEVKKIMSTADIFVLNSRVDETGDMEGTPVTLLEAMSAKVPVVSTYHAGIPDVVEDEVNGLLVPEKDNIALEKALDKLINNPKLRTRYADKARITVEKKHTVEHMKRKLEQVYETI